MTTLYADLAHARDELRRAKDHEQTIRAITEYVELSGKSVDDRKRELAFVLSQDTIYRKVQSDLRDAERAVDDAQAAIDQAETERRDREWSVRARLADALREKHIESEDDVPGWLTDKRTVSVAKARAQMDEVFGR